ncbi:hypothetical protein V8G54_037690, partial [Vigna mungo]
MSIPTDLSRRYCYYFCVTTFLDVIGPSFIRRVCCRCLQPLFAATFRSHCLLPLLPLSAVVRCSVPLSVTIVQQRTLDFQHCCFAPVWCRLLLSTAVSPLYAAVNC